jgi:hypothetical protein
LTPDADGGVMFTSMPHSRPTQIEAQADAVSSTTFECTPWLALERVLEEPRPRPEEPFRLAMDEHMVDDSLDGEAIRRIG